MLFHSLQKDTGLFQCKIQKKDNPKCIQSIEGRCFCHLVINNNITTNYDDKDDIRILQCSTVLFVGCHLGSKFTCSMREVLMDHNSFNGNCTPSTQSSEDSSENVDNQPQFPRGNILGEVQANNKLQPQS